MGQAGKLSPDFNYYIISTLYHYLYTCTHTIVCIQADTKACRWLCVGQTWQRVTLSPLMLVFSRVDRSKQTKGNASFSHQRCCQGVDLKVGGFSLRGEHLRLVLVTLVWCRVLYTCLTIRVGGLWLDGEITIPYLTVGRSL